MSAVLPYAPMLSALVGGVLAMLLSAWRRPGASVAVSIAGAFVGFLVALALVLRDPVIGPIGVGGAFSLPSGACLLFAGIALTASYRPLVASSAGPRIAALATFAAAAAALVAVALDLGLLFLSVEALALCGYGLVALAGTHRAREAAMKWFIQGSIATTVFIAGMAVLLSVTDGSLAYGAIADAASASISSGRLATGIVLVLIALAFKAGSFPFHSWMPDAFETAPATVAAVLASAGKVAPISAIAWITVFAAGATGERAFVVAAVLSVSSIVFGNLAALRQRSLARMLAYSGIAQVGYVLAGVPLAAGAGPVLIFGLLYGLTSLASFIFIVALQDADPGWDGSIQGMAGLSRRHPALAGSLVIVMLSLTGIPLTAGFWGKFLVFATASVGGYLWLAIAGMLGSVISFAYYGGVLRAAFMDEPSQEPEIAGALTRGPLLATSTVIAVAALIVIVGVLPIVTGLGMLTTPG